MPMSSREGARVTTADAYLPAGDTPPNLTVRPDSHVAEIVFDGMRATGVRLLDGTVIEAGRVVLSAGTYGSPALLMRSGIGPPEHLHSVGLTVRGDLPGVGRNLADHAGIDIDCGYEGPARSSPILHLAATFHSDLISSSEAPDLMLWLSDPEGDPAGFEITIMLMRPRARGSVRLRSADPGEPPLIELPDRRDPFDVERLAEGYRRALEVASRPEIRRLCAGPTSHEPAVGDELSDRIRADSFAFPHVVGTCAMGPDPERGAVVDTSGSVHGMQRLSIVDASIVPNCPSAFTHILTVMIAERLSELIADSDRS
jgi:choline dehydrogenase